MLQKKYLQGLPFQLEQATKKMKARERPVIFGAASLCLYCFLFLRTFALDLYDIMGSGLAKQPKQFNPLHF